MVRDQVSVQGTGVASKNVAFYGGHSIIEINKGFAGVGFLDDHLRESMYYAFKKISAGMLFLSMATYREFDGETVTVTLGTTYSFAPEGTVKIRKQSFKPPALEIAETSADVSQIFTAFLDFGEYDD